MLSLDQGLPDKNQFNAIQLCLRKAISSVPYQRAGKCASVKSISIDVPCSQKVFIDRFASPVMSMCYSLEENYKCTLSPSDLNPVFGANWHIFQYVKSCTTRRIIGLIVLHFRKKTASICRFQSDRR